MRFKLKFFGSLANQPGSVCSGIRARDVRKQRFQFQYKVATCKFSFFFNFKVEKILLINKNFVSATRMASTVYETDNWRRKILRHDCILRTKYCSPFR